MTVLKMLASGVFAVLLTAASGCGAEKSAKTESEVDAGGCGGGSGKTKMACKSEGKGHSEHRVVKMRTEGGEKVVTFGDGDHHCGMLGDDIDAGTKGKLLDERIKHTQATGPMVTELSVKRMELLKLKLAEKPDEAKVKAKQAEVDALKEKLTAKTKAFKATAQALLPEGKHSMMLSMEECDMLGMTCGTGGCGMMGMGKGMGMDIDIETGADGKVVKKVIRIEKCGEEADD